MSGRLVLDDLSAIVFGSEESIASNLDNPRRSDSQQKTGPLLDVPNPYRPNNRILMRTPVGHSADVALYGTDGRRLRTIYRGAIATSAVEFYWDGRTDEGVELGSGVYYLRAEVDGHQLSRKILLIK
jgi:hypothetical protein